MSKQIKLKEGADNLNVREPIIHITGTGKNCYLWIGNNALNDKWCYATLSGRKRLEKFAKTILTSLK